MNTTSLEKKTGAVTQPLRDEHAQLLPSIEALRTAGDAVGAAPLEQQRQMVHASYEFLTTKLIPHAQAEDKVLYVQVDRLLGASGDTRATDTMRRDHTEVGRLTERLGELGGKLHEGELEAADQAELRRVLYGLNVLVGVHFAKEEEVYLPLLDRSLTAAEANAIFEEMERATTAAGGGGHSH